MQGHVIKLLDDKRLKNSQVPMLRLHDKILNVIYVNFHYFRFKNLKPKIFPLKSLLLVFASYAR